MIDQREAPGFWRAVVSDWSTTFRFLVVFVVIAGATRLFLLGLEPTVAYTVAGVIGGLSGGGAVAARKNRKQ